MDLDFLLIALAALPWKDKNDLKLVKFTLLMNHLLFQCIIGDICFSWVRSCVHYWNVQVMKKTHYYLVDTSVIIPGAAVSALQFNSISEEPFFVHGLKVGIINNYNRLKWSRVFHYFFLFTQFIFSFIAQSIDVFKGFELLVQNF